MAQLLRLMLLAVLVAVTLVGGNAAEGDAPPGVTVVSSKQEPLFDDLTTEISDGKSAVIIRGGAVVRKVGGRRQLTRQNEDVFLRDDTSGETVMSSKQESLFDASVPEVSDGKSALVIRGGAVVRKVGGWHELTRHIEDTVLRGAALSDDDLAAQVMKLLGRPLSDDNMLRQVKALLRYRNDRPVLHIQVRLFVDGAGEPSQGNSDNKNDGNDSSGADDNDKDDGDDMGGADDNNKVQERSGGDTEAGGGAGDHEVQGNDNGDDKDDGDDNGGSNGSDGDDNGGSNGSDGDDKDGSNGSDGDDKDGSNGNGGDDD